MDEANVMRASAVGILGYMLTEEERASLFRLSALCQSTLHVEADEDKSADKKEGLGRDFTRSSKPKKEYVRQKWKDDKVYVNAIEHFITNIFNSLTGMRAAGFKALYVK